MKVLALTPDAPHLLRLLSGQVAAGVELAVEPSLGGGLKRLKETAWSLVLVDSLLEEQIVDVVERIAATGQRVVLLARSASVELTLDALRRGAWDMLPYPLDPTDLCDVIARSRATDEAMGTTGRRSGAVLVDPRRESPPGGTPVAPNTTLVGESPKIVAAFRAASRVAPSDASVLVVGESGTGKELLARFLHERSRRRDGPFVVVHCAGIPDHLLEGELFGHERGAFAGAVGSRAGRFERAHGGTLFLDEIGEMSLPLQAKILRVLQEREVERVGTEDPIPIDVRIVAATNRTLAEEVAAGSFREDLYYRLAVVVLSLPPLRERGDDIRLLAEHCLAKAALDRGCDVREIAPETMDSLRNYPWPGNVRQLCSSIERATIMADGPVLLPHHLPPEIRNHPRQATARPADGRPPADPLPPLEALERDHIRRALALTGGQLGRAADLLGIHRNTLRRKLRDWGLDAETEPRRSDASKEQTDALPS